MGLIARALEAAGIPTVSLTCMLDITRSVKPPRAAFVDFPPGHTSGRPFDVEQQYGIVRATLELLETVTVSGTIVPLPFIWPDGEGWKRDPLPPRIERFDTPQYQTEADRLAAAGHEHELCLVCAIPEPASR
ncbi:MAG: hypothetical protein ACYDCQ_10215 [Dehalococcoidia bacterium]